MEQISIASIVVTDRYRKDVGDIAGLAESIKEIGQIQPIVINKDRRLIAGGRRLEAMKMLGMQTIAASVFDLDDLDALKVERDENDQRKAPTVSERVDLANAIAERLQGRQLANLVQNRTGNISGSDKGDTRDIAAAKSGLGSGKTLEAAQKVVECGATELVAAMDAGKVTIHAAKTISTLTSKEIADLDFDDKTSVRNAAEKARSRISRSKTKPDTEEVATTVCPPKAKADESRLYEKGSCLSAWVLAARAKSAIEQISKKDPNAIAAIESVRTRLELQISIITA